MEARVQSARMASEVHKKRTGRALRISEEAVRKEEVYEEDEDDLPIQYRLFAAQLPASAIELNKRLDADVVARAAVGSLARYEEVDRIFARHFPTNLLTSQQFLQSGGQQTTQTRPDSARCLSPTSRSAPPNSPLALTPDTNATGTNVTDTPTSSLAKLESDKESYYMTADALPAIISDRPLSNKPLGSTDFAIVESYAGTISLAALDRVDPSASAYLDSELGALEETNYLNYQPDGECLDWQSHQEISDTNSEWPPF